MKAIELLYSLQATCNRFRNDTYSNTNYDEFRAEYLHIFGTIYNEKSFRESYFRHKAEEAALPTKYQDSLFYSQIEPSIEPLSKLIDKRDSFVFFGKEIKLRPIPLYGTLELENHNAFIAMADDEPVIVINEGIIKLLMEFSTLAVANFLYGIFDSELQNKIIRHYIDFVICNLFYKNKDIAIQWSPDDGFEVHFLSFQKEVFETALRFVFAHEYSHYVLGHIGTLKTVEINKIKVNMEHYDWVQEYDADLLGARFALAGRPLTRFLGIFLALESLFLSDIYIHNSTSHPPIFERVGALRKFAKNSGYNDVSCYMFEMVVEPLAVQVNLFLKYLIEKDKKIEKGNVEEIQNIIYNEFPIVPQKSMFSV